MQNRHKPSMPMPSKRTSVMARSPDRDRHDSAESSSDEDSLATEDPVGGAPEGGGGGGGTPDRPSRHGAFPPPPPSDTSSAGSPPPPLPAAHRPQRAQREHWTREGITDISHNYRPCE
nr:unnamed protein product [Callosobruchus chinensis]